MANNLAVEQIRAEIERLELNQNTNRDVLASAHAEVERAQAALDYTTQLLDDYRAVLAEVTAEKSAPDPAPSK